MDNKKEVRMMITPDNRCGQYVNAFAIHLRDEEVIIDAGFHPPLDKEIEITSRLIMNYKTAEGFMHNLQNALLDKRNANKKN